MSDSVYDESVELISLTLIPPSEVKQVLFSPVAFRSKGGISRRFGILSCLLLSGNRKALYVGITLRFIKMTKIGC